MGQMLSWAISSTGAAALVMRRSTGLLFSIVSAPVHLQALLSSERLPRSLRHAVPHPLDTRRLRHGVVSPRQRAESIGCQASSFLALHILIPIPWPVV